MTNDQTIPAALPVAPFMEIRLTYSRKARAYLATFTASEFLAPGSAVFVVGNSPQGIARAFAMLHAGHFGPDAHKEPKKHAALIDALKAARATMMGDA